MSRIERLDLHVRCPGKSIHRYFNILGLSLVALIVFGAGDRANAHSTFHDLSVIFERQPEHTAYTAPHDLGLPNRREPGGTR